MPVRSASRWPGALEFWASCTSATICASAVSAPTRVARTRRVPVVLIVAPITSTVRGAPSEVLVGVVEGLKHESAVNLDHVQTVEKTRLVGYIGALGPEKMGAVCRAMAVAVGCDG